MAIIDTNIKKLKDQVASVLEASVPARNDDVELVRRVCELFGYDPISKASAIERWRRYWQAEGKYLPTDERIVKQRRQNVDVWRLAMNRQPEQKSLL